MQLSAVYLKLVMDIDYIRKDDFWNTCFVEVVGNYVKILWKGLNLSNPRFLEGYVFTVDTNLV